MTDAAPSNPSEPHIAHTLLSRAHSPTTTNTLFTDRVVKRAVTLRPTSPTPSARATRRSARASREAATKARKSKKPRPLSAAQKRALCLYEIPKEQQKYAIYEPLHSMWCGYMREVLGLVKAEGEQGRPTKYVTPAGAGPMVASADLHGAAVEVVRSRCVSRVGLKGIVVRDTKFVFDIVTKGDVVKTVPKEHTIFRFEVPFLEQEGQQQHQPLVFEIHGEHFQRTAPDRAKKSFKMHFVPDL
ncbi:ribonuclease-like protein P complex subunit Pop4 [Mytilinidion resinicola]|uniref:Ribonuclease P protein subunit n=1 Tax=Mytilinidion resinicola TaxID=574789 RepID=A0A6A6YK05_9PEZI|nr:ribonuclease-like protein P complex subunit Pop4 [Mytilinidion resinicola]KAF2808295.1 ribonuclease-like protein P complex subunit Pop4 [Mytilinidion resinicola]